jgi:hypothetical protein
LARSPWVTEVDEPHNRPLLCWGTEVQCGNVSWVTEVQYEKYAGSRKCSTENMLGHGSAVRKIILGHGRPLRLASAPLLSRQVPAALLACCALPCPSLISIHTPPLSRGRTFVLGLAKRLASSRRSSLPRSPLSPRPRSRPVSLAPSRALSLPRVAAGGILLDSAPSSPRVAAVSSVRQCGSLSDSRPGEGPSRCGRYNGSGT